MHFAKFKLPNHFIQPWVPQVRSELGTAVTSSQESEGSLPETALESYCKWEWGECWTGQEDQRLIPIMPYDLRRILNFTSPFSKDGWWDNSNLEELFSFKIWHFWHWDTSPPPPTSFVFSVKTTWELLTGIWRHKPSDTMEPLNSVQSSDVI